MSDVEDAGGVGAAIPVREKMTGSSSVTCPMLTSTNYTVWALRMKIVLRIHKAWITIDPGTEKNEERNYLAIGLIYQAIPESLIMLIGDVDSSKALWESIKARYVGADRVKEARLQTLSVEFDRLKMTETESIDNFAGKLSGISSKSASLGESIEESKMVKKLLKSVPKKFIHIVTSLEQVLDLKTVGYEDIVGRLKAYEERVREADDGGEAQARVMFVKNGGGAGSKKWGRNRSGEGFNRTGSGSGSGSDGSESSGGSGSNPAQNSNRPNNFKQNPKNRPNFTTDPNSNPKKDMSKIICYRCDKSGHYASKCPDRIQKFQESNFAEQDEADEAVFFHETVFLKEEKVIPSRYNSQENDV